MQISDLLQILSEIFRPTFGFVNVSLINLLYIHNNWIINQLVICNVLFHFEETLTQKRQEQDKMKTATRAWNWSTVYIYISFRAYTIQHHDFSGLKDATEYQWNQHVSYIFIYICDLGLISVHALIFFFISFFKFTHKNSQRFYVTMSINYKGTMTSFAANNHICLILEEHHLIRSNLAIPRTKHAL